MNKLEEAEPLLKDAYELNAGRIGPGFYWEDFAGQPYSHLLIRNRKYSEAEKVARDTLIQINAELGKDGPWKIWAEFNASTGWVYCYTQLVEALCRLGRFEEAKRLVAEQLGPGAAQTWSPAQLKTFKTLQLTAQAYSGEWVKAAPGLVVLATDKQANVRDWGNGVVAAFASGDTKEYDRLCRWGRVRYAGNARADTANTLFWGLILRPREEDLSDTLPELLRRVEEDKEYSWTVVNLLFMSSQLAYRKGEYEEALRLLNEWIKFKDERSPNVNELYFMRASPMPDFWRAMIQARRGRAEEAAKAYGDGAKKLRAGLPINDEDFTTVWYFYNSQALRQEAREVLRSQGIAVPDTGTTP
jgi:pentatricopeptide repeat protein